MESLTPSLITISPKLRSKWLEKDLAATRKPLIWIIGHVPIKSFPDMDTGRKRHEGGSLTSNPAHLERFLQLLKQYHVKAFICGHTHNCSVTKVEGVWQADSGHARGAGDTGAPSTFLKFRIAGDRAWVDIYRERPQWRNVSTAQDCRAGLTGAQRSRKPPRKTTSARVTARKTALTTALRRKKATLIQLRLRRRAIQCSNTRQPTMISQPTR